MAITKVIFTIDVEHGSGGIPYRISGDLTKFGIQKNYGINAIMDIFEEYNMRAVFFANIYETNTFDPPYEDYMERICSEICRRGHELGLHWHSLKSNTTYFNSKTPPELTLEEQTVMIRKGVEFIEKHGGVRPISYRSGAYRVNEDTLKACEINNIKYDSSLYFGDHRNMIKYYKTISAPYYEGNLIEVPIVPVVSNNGKLTKLDFDFLPLEQLIEAIYNMKAMNFPIIQIMFHSFSLLKRAENKEKALIICKEDGNHSYSGGDDEKLVKLKRLLSYLELSPDFEVTTFKNIDVNDLKLENIVDGFIATNSKFSYEIANALNIANMKIIDKKEIILDPPVHHYSLHYYAESNKISLKLNIQRKAFVKYAYYLQNENGDTIGTTKYSESLECTFIIPHTGKYRIKFYIQESNVKSSYFTKYISIKERKDIELYV